MSVSGKEFKVFCGIIGYIDKKLIIPTLLFME